jgi:DNA-binding transcriptional MerR regulator
MPAPIKAAPIGGSGDPTDPEGLSIGEVVQRTGMSASRIRYYESRGLLAEPARVGGKRRYPQEVLHRLAIVDDAQRVGFTLDEIRDLLGSRDQPAHERLRQLALLKLPELDELIDRATTVRRLMEVCSRCNCASIDVCRLFRDPALRLRDQAPPVQATRRAGRTL